MSPLPWPPEAARYPDAGVRSFVAPASNWVLDFHGDPCAAGLAVLRAMLDRGLLAEVESKGQKLAEALQSRFGQAAGFIKLDIDRIILFGEALHVAARVHAFIGANRDIRRTGRRHLLRQGHVRVEDPRQVQAA